MPHPIAVCLGTDPEVVRLAPVIHEMARRDVPVVVVSTGAGGATTDRMLATFEVQPAVDLRHASAGRSRAERTARTSRALGDVLGRLRPEAVVMQADTATAICAAPAAFSHRIPVAQVEAGRRGALAGPFAGDADRRLVGQLATWHFAPSETARENLLREGIAAPGVEMTAGTVADAARWVAGRHGLLERPRAAGARRVLVAVRGGEGRHDAPTGIGRTLARLAERADVELAVAPPRSPAAAARLRSDLAAHENVTLLEGLLGYERFLAELAASHVVLTDAGRVQEEAAAFGIPALVASETTERPEGVRAGRARLCGSDPVAVLQHAERLLDDDALHARMATAPNPYGDGRAAERIVARLAGDLVGIPAADVHSRILAA